ncbi:MAG: energy-coupling factor transporter transmembrane protein EcfT [Spirochaetaceae bacterium]|jgi:cobalt/nickel transport system permease protein|nr:energy-coupling factor transporter transmembrane protein EcfT [Spirochaetaceae bacterium]
MYLDRLEYKKDFLFPLDKRCRFLSAALLIIAAVYTTNLAALSGIIGFCVLLLSRELRVTFLRLTQVNMMTAALWLTAPFGFSIDSALLYTLRINAAALLYMIFIVPMSVSAIASSMTKLKVPEKLVSLFILSYRYIFLLGERLATMLVSMRLRSPENSTFRLWRSFAAVFAATTARAVVRSQKVSLAMISRGFDGVFPVTVTFKWKARDTILLLLCAGLSALALYFGIKGGSA